MKTPNSVECPQTLQSFVGTITDVDILEADFGRATLKMSIQNRHESIDAIFEPSAQGDPLPNKDWGVVQLMSEPRKSLMGKCVKGYKLTRLRTLDSLDHLPASHLERPALVDQAQAWVRTCPIPVLRQFTWQVLGHPNIGIPFFRAQASEDHHHAYLGGLAEHSLAVAKLTLQSLPEMDEREAWLCAIAGLMHDIGKIRCFDEKGKIAAGFVLRHEQWTLEILAGALEWMDRQWPDGALAIRCLLTSHATPESQRPLLPGAMAITYADRMNSALQVRAKVFSERPQWQRFARTKGFGPPSRFWLPSRVSL
ncbi:HD domain-containing protein [Marinobacter sp. NP-6]|uniref:HD domain-containing protein n=1 Tax=Marinobacter sp. NP-6 TaxID=2488666 RepID=UPI000FCC0BC7|nr:HD domain-containing protein [Marinobacter sp. NP-6]RUT76889.1 HD domain-containing protein [Marinobacter sp. NP-6]